MAGLSKKPLWPRSTFGRWFLGIALLFWVVASVVFPLVLNPGGSIRIAAEWYAKVLGAELLAAGLVAAVLFIPVVVVSLASSDGSAREQLVSAAAPFVIGLSLFVTAGGIAEAGRQCSNSAVVMPAVLAPFYWDSEPPSYLKYKDETNWTIPDCV